MFEDDARIRNHLVSRGIASEEQVSQAIDYAFDRGIDFEDALVALRLLSFAELGNCLSELSQMPYRPLMNKAPSSFCKKMLPLELVMKWNVFPVDYEPENDLFTIAISSPDQIKSFLRLEQKLFAHHHLTFCVASRAEINQAIKTFYQTPGAAGETAPVVPHDFSILNAEDGTDALSLIRSCDRDDKKILLFEPDIDKGRALRTLLRREGYGNVTWVSSEREAARAMRSGAMDLLVIPEVLRNQAAQWNTFMGSRTEPMPMVTYRSIAPLILGQELPYQAVSDSLTALVGAVVRQSLASEQERLRETVERARYCKLLALRMQLSSYQVDRAALAGWLYKKDHYGSLIAPLAKFFRIERLIDEAMFPTNNRTPESLVVSTVAHLFECKRQRPGIMNDTKAIREYPKERVGGTNGEHAIESLLALLSDEAFISKIDRPAARILIADPNAHAEDALALHLRNDGYAVTVTATGREALGALAEGNVDCIIADTELGDGDGIELCKTVKAHAAYAATPFVFVAASTDQRVMAGCLRAGADDFLVKPVDPEVLALKLHRLISKKTGADSRPGIKGSLSEVCFSDLVQILSSGQKSVKITLFEGESGGELYLDHGEIVHAVAGNSSGEAAFYRLMRFAKGEFEVVPCATFPRRTIAMSVVGLLMESARIDDETMRDASPAE
jgi:DNA-binding response OmpR family regulator